MLVSSPRGLRCRAFGPAPSFASHRDNRKVLPTLDFDQATRLRQGPVTLWWRPAALAAELRTVGTELPLRVRPGRRTVVAAVERCDLLRIEQITDLVAQSAGYPSVLTCSACRGASEEGQCRRCLGITADERVRLVLGLRGLPTQPPDQVLLLRLRHVREFLPSPAEPPQ